MTNSPEGAHHESDQTQPINVVSESTERIEATSTEAPTPPVQESAASTGPVFEVPDATQAQQSQQAQPQKQRAHDVKFSTIVWGLIVAFAGAIIVLAALGISFDMQLVAIIALGISGVVLLGGALVRAIRS